MLGLITLGGAALRAYGLGAHDLWLDEANTALIAAQPFEALLRQLRDEDVHPPLFYLLAKAPLAVWPSEVGLRLLPWFFGVLCIPAAFLAARDLAGRRAGLSVAVLVAASAPLVIFSQEGRSYSLLALLELLATWSLWRALEAGGRRWWACFALTSAAALYTHNLAGLFLLAHLLCGLATRGQAGATILAGSAALGLYLPWLPIAVAQTSSVASEGGWLGSAPPLWMPAVTFLNLLSGTQARHGLLSPLFALEHLYLLGGAVALLVFGWRRLRGRPIARRVMLATGLGPIALAWAVSQFTRVYVDKTFLVDAVLLFLVMGAASQGSQRMARRAGPVLAGGLLLLAQLWAVGLNWGTPHESYRALVQDLQDQALTSDLVLAVPDFLSRPTLYYAAATGSALTMHGVNENSLESLPTDASRLWVISGGPWGDAPASKALSEWRQRHGYRSVWERLYPDPALRLTLFDRGGRREAEGERGGAAPGHDAQNKSLYTLTPKS